MLLSLISYRREYFTIALAAILLLIAIVGVAFYMMTHGKPDPVVLSYESHHGGDYYVFYVCLTNKGGDGKVEVTCKIDCLPVDPFPTEHQEVTPDGTVITYTNGTISTYHVAINLMEPLLGKKSANQWDT